MAGIPFLGKIGVLLVGAFILIGVILLAVWLVGSAVRSSPPTPRVESPLDILKARYARGEIRREQYEQMRRDLE